METNPRSMESTNRVLSSDSSTPGGFPKNPFVGLRPFRSDEGLLFFGRREQTLELLQQLQQSRFLAVVGSSGCGKSSLIRAGLIPKLEAGFLVEQRDQWRIATAKPGDAPLHNLAESLVQTFADGSDGADIASLVDGMTTLCAQAVVDFLRTRLKDSEANLLLLIDQFEELFTFGRYGQREINDSDDTRSKETQTAERLERERRRDEAADFVSIMLGLAEQSELPIYVVMTMRSDFLGDCDVFYGLPEAINVSQYLVPRLARPQRQEAIENPIRLYGRTISQRLLDRILNDAGEEADQLPVMQHAMMRTWDKWKASGDSIVDLEHYEAAGGLKQALSDDAEEALAGMSPEDVNITKKLFQALTDTDLRGRRIRRPTHLREIEAITNASREKLLEIISHFSGHGRSFLHLSQEQLEPLVDISHESLIRQWGRLREWVTRESRSREIYLRLVGTAVRYYKPVPEDDLLRGAALSLALEWCEKRKPNQAWANRYHPALDLALKFLDESKAQRDRDAAEAERQRNAALEQKQQFAEAEAAARKKELDQALELATQREAAARWQRRAIYGLAFLLILAVATTVYAVRAGYKAKQQKDHAEQAEAKAELLSAELAAYVERLKTSVRKEQGYKDELAGKLKTEEKLKGEAERLKVEAEKQAHFAKQQAARAKREATRANFEAARAQKALDEANRANKLALDKADEAFEEKVKALATQSANQTFRDALGLSRINNPAAAAKKYNEAADAYKSLTERDYEGEGIALLELADMYLRSHDQALFDQGAGLLRQANEAFLAIEKTKPVQSNNGQAAAVLKMRDFMLSDRVLREVSDEEADEFREEESEDMLKKAYGFYDDAKNAEGMAFIADLYADVIRTSLQSVYHRRLASMYGNQVAYYPEQENAPKKVSLFLKIASVFKRLNDTAEATTHFENALKVYRDFSDPEGVARTYVDIGFLLGTEKELGTEEDIAKNIELALQTIGRENKIGEASTLRYVCRKYQETWSKGPAARPGFVTETAATEYCSRALAIYQSLTGSPGSRIRQAETLTDLGTINAANKSIALQHFQAAYKLYQEEEKATSTADNLKNIEEKEKNNKRQKAKAALLLNIGAIQEQMGQLDEALESFEEARRTLSDQDVLIDALRAKRGFDRVNGTIPQKKSAVPD